MKSDTKSKIDHQYNWYIDCSIYILLYEKLLLKPSAVKINENLMVKKCEDMSRASDKKKL